MSDSLLNALIGDDVHSRLTRTIDAPTEDQVSVCSPAVDLSIADDRMIPAEMEWMNQVVIPRWASRQDDGMYRLNPSRVAPHLAPTEVYLTEVQAIQARARFLLWNGYYVAAYDAGRLSFIQRDAVRRLYWFGGAPPRDPYQMMVDGEIKRALRQLFS